MLLFTLFFLFSFSYGGELEEILSYALENSPKIKEYEKLKKSLEYREKYALSLPNPTFFVGLSNLPINKPYPNAKEPMSSFTIGFSQMYVLPIKRELESKVFYNERKTLEENEDILKKELARDIKLKYLEWVYTFKKEKILLNIKSEIERLEHMAKVNYTYGKTTLSDLLSLKGEVLKISKDIESLKELRGKLKEEIDYLVGKSFELKGEDIKLPHADFNIDLDNTVYLRKLKTELSTLDAELQRKKVEHLPDFEVMVEYMARPSMSHMFSLKIGFTVPMRRDERENLAVLEKLSQIDAKREELKDTILKLRKLLNTLRLEYESKKELLRITEELLKEKNNELKALEIAYQYNKANFRDILRLHKEMWELEVSRLELELELRKLLFQLEVFR